MQSELFAATIKDYGTEVVKTPAFECLLPCERSPLLEDCQCNTRSPQSYLWETISHFSEPGWSLKEKGSIVVAYT